MPSVSVSFEWCCAANRPVNMVLRETVHMAAAVKACVKVTPRSFKRFVFGRLVSSQPGGNHIGGRS